MVFWFDIADWSNLFHFDNFTTGRTRDKMFKFKLYQIMLILV